MIEKTYLIWGIEITLKADNYQLLKSAQGSLELEFSGAIDEDNNSTSESHTFWIRKNCPEGLKPHGLKARHLGGSAGDKRFLDGSVFLATSQNRDVAVCRETTNFGVYELDGCIVSCSSAVTTIFGEIHNKRHVLADLVEAYILEYTRRCGWLQCHGSGWVEDSSASIAVGDSGSGKTTKLLASISSGGLFLGNDRLFLRLRNGMLEARGYPLAMNIGCGTIRSLNLDVPHFGGLDREKIRLTPKDVTDRMDFDYSVWWKVKNITAPNKQSLIENFYINPDPCHPIWNIVWSTPFNRELGNEILEFAISKAHFTSLLSTKMEPIS